MQEKTFRRTLPATSLQNGLVSTSTTSVSVSVTNQPLLVRLVTLLSGRWPKHIWRSFSFLTNLSVSSYLQRKEGVHFFYKIYFIESTDMVCKHLSEETWVNLWVLLFKINAKVHSSATIQFRVQLINHILSFTFNKYLPPPPPINSKSSLKIGGGGGGYLLKVNESIMINKSNPELNGSTTSVPFAFILNNI